MQLQRDMRDCVRSANLISDFERQLLLEDIKCDSESSQPTCSYKAQ